MILAAQPAERNIPQERIAILRSGHGRANGSFTTAASYVVSVDGARLLAGRHITARSASRNTRGASQAPPAPLLFRLRPARPADRQDERKVA